MTMYLGLLSLSSEEAGRIVEHGPAERRAFIDLLVREAGGTVEGFWLTDVGEWDVVCLVDMHEPISAGPAHGAAATLARRAAGLTRREQWIALADPDDVAGAMEKLRSGPTSPQAESQP